MIRRIDGSPQWQPIETAPNGDFVLITDGKTIEVGINNGFGWFSSDGLDFNFGAFDSELTHWMPLPEPP